MTQLPSIFSNGMVLAKQARIWGFCDSSESVRIDFLGQTYTVTPTADSQSPVGYSFEHTLESPEYGGPHSLTIGEHTLQDVYIGRVFLCAGQSNMEQPLTRALGLEAHIKPDSRIRAFQAEKNLHFGEPKTDVNGKWESYTGDFSHLFGVPYFFARKMLESLNDNVPVGLLNVAAGGTPVEAWLSEATVQKHLPEAYERLQPNKDPEHVDQLVTAGDERYKAWFGELNFKTTGEWQAVDLLTPVMHTPGAVVYRRELPYLAGELQLNLGRVIDSIRVFINGQEIGHIGYQYPPAVFTVPDGVLKPDVTNWIELQVLGETQPPYFVAGKTYALSNAGGASVELSCGWEFQITMVKEAHAGGVWFYNFATGCYNYMLAPVIKYGIDAFLWYQGESNTGDPTGYADKFELLVNSIREHNPHAPVYYVQLANLVNPNAPWPAKQQYDSYNLGTGWAVLREEQRKCLSLPNAHMAVTIDCGEYNDLHPADKKTVGERLALLYLDPSNTGPVVSGHSVVDGVLTINFKQGAGLWSKNGRPLLDFGNHQMMEAKIIGESLRADISQLVTPPSVVRFGWSDCPAVTLYNAKGLPASPFEIVL